jgi:2-polyprenyl-6-methoxyphenol hydroxylase-like FAD-dependent oxidoreductase
MRHVIIIGGGIGGLACAIALQQRGMSATVYEAAPDLQPDGAGILMPPNAMQVLDTLGLAGAVAQNGVALRHAEIHDARAGLLQRVDMGALAERYRFATIAIPRARLHSILAGALAPGSLELGRACVSVEDDGSGVQARFADGSLARGELLVGADGLRSAVRRQLFPETGLRYSGQGSYRAIAALALPDALGGVAQELWAPGRRFGFAAVGPSDVYWYATLDAAAGELRQRAGDLGSLRTIFAAFPAIVGHILAHSAPERLVQTDIYDLAPLPGWHTGRIALLGDAAHATTPNLGQGGAQAIEDALALAECLAAFEQPQAAFRLYEQRRRAKVTMVVRRSWQIGRLAHLRNPLGRALRNAAMRHTPGSAVQRQFEAIYRAGAGAPPQAHAAERVS